MKRLLSGLALVVLAVAGSPLALTTARGGVSNPHASAPLPVPPSFKLKASNGYSIVVLAAPARRGHLASALVLVRRRDSEVAYAVPAAVTETSIRATIGQLGRIDVTFHAANRATTEHSACGGRDISFDAGYYEGVIELTGEEGFTRASASRAKGDIQLLLNIVCAGNGGVVGSGPGVPGAELNVRTGSPQQRIRFAAGKNDPGSRARFEASIDERRDGISISRNVQVVSVPAAFEYDRRLTLGRVKPPAPFSGSALPVPCGFSPSLDRKPFG